MITYIIEKKSKSKGVSPCFVLLNVIICAREKKKEKRENAKHTHTHTHTTHTSTSWRVFHYKCIVICEYNNKNGILMTTAW